MVTMSEEEKLRSQILALEDEIFKFRKEKDSLFSEVEKLLEEKRKIQQQIFDCRKKIESYKAQRDKVNQEIKELKDSVKTLRNRIFEKIEKCKKLRSEIVSLRRQVLTGKNTAKEMFENLEWKIQTTSLTPIEEKALVDKVKFLEKELQIHQQIEVKEEEFRKESGEIESLKKQVDSLKDKISGLVEESRKAHEKMVEFLKRKGELKEKAGILQQKLSELKTVDNDLHRKIVEASVKKRRLEEKLREIVEEARIRKAIEVSEKIVEDAEKKLGKGDKLTFEEFRLLMSRRKLEFKS